MPAVGEVLENRSYMPSYMKTVDMAREVSDATGVVIFVPSYMKTVDMAREASDATGVVIFVTVGPYPVDYLTLRDRFGRDEAKQIMFRGMEEAQHLCLEGKAIAIGEIGRPHFEVDEHAWDDSNEIMAYGMSLAWDDSNEIMAYGMSLAREAGVPVVLHTESMREGGFAELAEMADRTGIAREKVIKHFSPPLVAEDENHGREGDKEGNIEGNEISHGNGLHRRPPPPRRRARAENRSQEGKKISG